MSHSEFQDLMTKKLEDRLSQDEYARLTKILAEDPDLESQYRAALELQRRAHDWHDLPAPAWDRAPQSLRFQSRRQRLWQWMPLATAAVLLLAVVFNVSIEAQNGGLDIKFGQTGIDQAQFDAYRGEVADLVSDMRAANDRQMRRALNDFADSQDEKLDQALASFDQDMRSVRRDEYKALLTNWRRQREMDLQVIASRYSNLYDASLENRNSILTLAEYVKR